MTIVRQCLGIALLTNANDEIWSSSLRRCGLVLTVHYFALQSPFRHPGCGPIARLNGHVYRYIRSSTILSALYQYHTPIIHSPTPCIHQVAHVHELRCYLEEAPLLPIVSLVLCLSPSPHLVEKEWCERQRGIHRVLNYLPRIIHLPVHHFKLDSHHHIALSEDTQPISAHFAFSLHQIVLSAVIYSLGSWSEHIFLGHDWIPSRSQSDPYILGLSFFSSPSSPCCWFTAYRQTMQQIISRISAGCTPF